MKIYKKDKNTKTSQVEVANDKKEKYTIRSMFSDLSKWENFVKLTESN